MKIATYNIQNLFYRDKRLIKESRLQKQHLWIEELEHLMLGKTKTEKEHTRMRELTELMGFNKTPYEPYLSMRNIDGHLMVVPSIEKASIKASHLTNWNGWIRLKSNPIRQKAIVNKAKVILDSNPDILLLQEVEDRSSLMEFNKMFLNDNLKTTYDEIVHMEGNDNKGLGTAILLKTGYRVRALKFFVDDKGGGDGALFDTGFYEYKVEAPNGTIIYILNCQILGETDSKAVLDAKRKRQATKIAEVYKGLVDKEYENIVIVGTLNAPSFADSISPILQQTDLTDIVKHNTFDVELDSGNDKGYFRMGAYRKGVNIKQKDYLLISSVLYQLVRNSGMNRKAVWPLKRPIWNTYDSVVTKTDSASEHPLIWVDMSLEEPKISSKKSA